MSHYIITKETYNLKHEQIIELMHQNIETLLTRIDELQLSHELMEDLILFDEEGKSEGNLLSPSKDYALFKDIKSTGISMKSKGTRFTKEQWLELKILLDKYPEGHSKIRRALKISRSTFWRLKHESQEGFRARELATRKKNVGWLLDDKQKVYVRRLVQPPTVPMTVRGI